MGRRRRSSATTAVTTTATATATTAPVAALLLLLLFSYGGSGGGNDNNVSGGNNVNAVTAVAAMTEEHRMEEYRKRGYKWPLEKMVPETPGWRKLMERRFEQMEHVKDEIDRYNGWMAFMTAAIVATNYTENGWGLTRAPEHIHRRLLDRLHRTLEVTKLVEENGEGCIEDDGGEEGGGGECSPIVEREVFEPRGEGTRTEHFVNVIEASDDSRPIMISDPAENRDILEEMRPMFEHWSGMDLQGSVAYGIRSYRNDSNLLMHVDKTSTHVISGIFHVDRSDDAMPWPIIIEDYGGNTNVVYLEPGDLLFYESSKCFHGRPMTFQGSYYASLFMHYAPADYDPEKMSDEVHYAVPEHWRERSPSPLEEGSKDELVIVGTSFKEPNCMHNLCALDDVHAQSGGRVDWHGPAPGDGRVVTAGWDPETMMPPPEQGQEKGGGRRRNGGASAGAGNIVVGAGGEEEL